jgi:hypothetical protein
MLLIEDSKKSYGEKNMKRIFVVAFMVALIVGGYLAFSTVDSTTPTVVAAKAYNATVYVAGHGGHFAKADVTVDPNNSDNAIKVNGLDMVSIGDTKTHKTHDARIDSNDPNVMFWSTYAKDPQGKMHVGKSDLKTGNVIQDVALDLDPRSPGTAGPLYCGSGQSKNDYMPVFMGTEGYVDVFDKATLKHKHRVFISDLGYKPAEVLFVHGINSNDMKVFAISLAMKGADGKPNGKNDVILVDLQSLENGKLKKIKGATFTGEPGKTITFRQYFSKDDKLIFQSAGDRIYVIDAATLKLVDEKMTPGEAHDMMPSPDGNIALVTLRTNADAVGADGKVVEKDGKPVGIKDGALQVYDAKAKKLVGKPVSVCIACHKDMGLGDKTAILCGMDANYN